MSDPADRLSSFDPGPSMNPLPPSEVRRRGDHLRRRNTALAGAGAALAVALIATPIAVLGASDDGSSDPDPAPSPPTGVDWRQSIPAGFPIDDLMGGDQASIVPRVSDDPPYGEIVFDTIQVCGSDAWAPNDASDLLGAVWSDRVAGGEQRTLALYADDAAAERVLTGLDEAVDGCSASSEVIASEPLASELGAQSTAWVEVYPDGRRPHVWQVARVGNALLLHRINIPDLEGTSQDTVAVLSERAAPVVHAMCLFSAEGCATTAPPPAIEETPPTSPGDIPGGFPLAAGWSASDGDSEITGPDRDPAPLELVACDAPVPDSSYADRMGASYSAPEDYRTRQLTTYVDADAAVAAVAAIVDAYRACPQDDLDESGYVSHHDVQPLEVGGESWAILARDTFEGSQSPFGATTIVVRVGRAVLLLDHGGHAGYPGDDWRAEVDALLAEASVPIAEMCAFTEAGCGGGTSGSTGGEVLDPAAGVVTLGLDRTALLALEGAEITSTTPQCEGFSVPVAGFDVTGGLQPGLGVAYLNLPEGMTTPEGIGPGATQGEVLAAYPDAAIDDPLVLAEAPGHDDRFYRGELTAEGTLGSWSLMHEQQRCGG